MLIGLKLKNAYNLILVFRSNFAEYSKKRDNGNDMSNEYFFN